MEFLQTNWADILFAITATVTAASAIVKLTPTPKDDNILAKIVSFLGVIGLNPRK
jgi:hypothetical protein